MIKHNETKLNMRSVLGYFLTLDYDIRCSTAPSYFMWPQECFLKVNVPSQMSIF